MVVQYELSSIWSVEWLFCLTCTHGLSVVVVVTDGQTYVYCLLPCTPMLTPRLLADAGDTTLHDTTTCHKLHCKEYSSMCVESIYPPLILMDHTLNLK